MRVRAMSAAGDMQFGRGSANFLVNSPQAVGQLLITRLNLRTGEWFLDTTAGTNWAGKVLGRNTEATRDAELKRVILGTPGVKSILSFVPQVTAQRQYLVTARIDTIYGPLTISSVPNLTDTGGEDFAITGGGDVGVSDSGFEIIAG